MPERGLCLLQGPAASDDGGIRFILESPDDNAWDQLAYACIRAFIELDSVTISEHGTLWSTALPCSELEDCLAGSHPDLLQEAERRYYHLEAFLRQERTWFVVYWDNGKVRLRVENMHGAFERDRRLVYAAWKRLYSRGFWRAGERPCGPLVAVARGACMRALECSRCHDVDHYTAGLPV